MRDKLCVKYDVDWAEGFATVFNLIKNLWYLVSRSLWDCFFPKVAGKRMNFWKKGEWIPKNLSLYRVEAEKVNLAALMSHGQMFADFSWRIK